MSWIVVSLIRWGRIQNFRPLGPLFLVEVEFPVGGWWWWWWTAIIMSNLTSGCGYLELWLGWGFDNFFKSHYQDWDWDSSNLNAKTDTETEFLQVSIWRMRPRLNFLKSICWDQDRDSKTLGLNVMTETETKFLQVSLSRLRPRLTFSKSHCQEWDGDQKRFLKFVSIIFTFWAKN